MYVPEAFATPDWDIAKNLMKENSFAQLLTVDESGELSISHIPFIYQSESHELLFHLAAANEHNSVIQKCQSTIVFSGPHGYISPSWAPSALQVPTWNYSALHLYGAATEQVNEEDKLTAMQTFSDSYEEYFAQPWSFMAQDRELMIAMFKAIKVYTVSIDSWQLKLKMSQNKKVAGVEQIITSLERTSYPYQDNLGLAQMMKRVNT